MFKEALTLLQKGYSIVASRRDDKRPVSNWTEFQSRLPTIEELQAWFKRDPNTNIGMITGKISDIVVIDIDKGTDITKLEEYYPLPITAITKTGGDGLHYFYKYPKGVERIGTYKRIFGDTSPFKVDVRADGGFVVLAPSIHPETGKRYEWLESLEKTTELPLHWLKAIENYSNSIKTNEGGTPQWEGALEGSSQGSRNVNMTSFVGLMMKKLPIKVWDDTIPPAMMKVNKKNNPQLPEKELQIIYNSIKKKELARRAETGEIEEDVPQKKYNDPKSVKTLYEQDIPPTLWLVDRLIPINSITVLAAASGAFKTWILMELALRIATKQKVFEEFEVLQDEFGILIIDEENWEGIIQTRLKLIIEEALVPNLEKLPIYFYNLELLKIVNDKDIIHILNICKEKNIKFVIFDSLNRIHNSDENSATEMNKVFNQMKKLQKEGLTILFTHHNRKQGILKPQDPAENMRGSGDIKASVDCQLSIEIKMLDEEKTLVMYQFKARAHEELEPFKIKILKDDSYIHFQYNGKYDVGDEKNSKINHHKPDVVAFVNNNPGCSTTEIVENFNGKLGASYVRGALKVLEKDMILKSEGNRPKKYFINKQTADDINAEEAILQGLVDPQQELLDND